MKTNKEKVPYIIQSGNFWYIADAPFTFEDGAQRGLAFCDILHDFLGISHTSSHKALVRIEDVNPLTDPSRIRAIADIMDSLKAPFIISLVPVYKNPAAKEEVRLSARPALYEALQYACAKGGTIALHGYTHQNTGVSTIDYEFWDMKTDRPLAEDSPLEVEKRIQAAVDECFACGLYPLLWVTPHYMASVKDYREIARHFSTVAERRIVVDRYDSRQSFPFIIEKDMYGQRVLPEYLGFVQFRTGSLDKEAGRKDVKAIIDGARTLQCVRDSCAGFFFHPFMDVALLKEAVTGMKAMGCSFLDARSLDNTMCAGNKAVASGKGTVTLQGKDILLREFQVDEKGSIRSDTTAHNRQSGIIRREVSSPPFWLYVAQGVEGKETALAAVLWKEKAVGNEKLDQEAFYFTFESLGIKVKKVASASMLKDENILAVPFGSALTASKGERQRIIDFAGKGNIVILDAFTPLSEDLQIEKGEKRDVKGVKDCIYKLDFFTSGAMETIVQKAGDHVIYQSTDGKALGIIRKEKKGGILFLSTPYDTKSGRGYTRFPTLVTIVLNHFSLKPPVFVPRIEAYFDPGLRENANTEDLVKKWRQIGIRSIHVGAWHFYPTYIYDYKRLIKECHNRGIYVYAWLELPYLTKDFWEKHPEFREKGWHGRDVQNFWRYPLALEDPACREAVFTELRKLFKEYDFDGVNLAELYFENEGEGATQPDTLTPFHPWAIEDFEKKYGFDMRDIFTADREHHWKKDQKALQSFYDYRADLIYRLHEDFIMFLDGIRKEKKDFDIVITVVDSARYPKAIQNWGVDSKKISNLMKKYPFTLMVEDPFTMWNLNPERYQDIKNEYLKIGVPGPLLALNLNVVDIHTKKDGFACARQTGTELYQLLHAASRGGHRVIMYAEATVLELDNPYVGYVMEAPPGSSIPTPFKKRPGAFQVLWSSGELYRLSEQEREISCDYHSPSTCYLVLTTEPDQVYLDKKNYEKKVLAGEGEWILCLPSGSHRVRVTRR
jgi:hypothetical protein